MDTYEVHVPCGQKVIVICEKEDKELTVLKNGETVYGETEEENESPKVSPPPTPTATKDFSFGKVAPPPAPTATKYVPSGKVAPPPTPTANKYVPSGKVAPPPAPTASKKSPSTEEDDMAGGKRSSRKGSRKTSRKGSATRKASASRKNQAGGKRGPNGYMKFASKMRPQILKEHPELKSDVVAVARKIGEKWRALSDAEKKKF